eukprot:309841_1
MNCETSFIFIISLYLLKSIRSEDTCEHCDPAEITNTYASCGDKPWCLYDASCLDSELSDDCWCNRHSFVAQCPIGDKCTDTAAGGGEVCGECEPCYGDGVETGHPDYRTKCYMDCEGNCVYQRKPSLFNSFGLLGKITQCIKKDTRKLACDDVGLALRNPHDCRCVNSSGSTATHTRRLMAYDPKLKCVSPPCPLQYCDRSKQYCNSLLRVLYLLGQTFDIPDEELCDDGQRCCCSCPNCDTFTGWPSPELYS